MWEELSNWKTSKCRIPIPSWIIWGHHPRCTQRTGFHCHFHLSFCWTSFDCEQEKGKPFVVFRTSRLTAPWRISKHVIARECFSYWSLIVARVTSTNFGWPQEWVLSSKALQDRVWRKKHPSRWNWGCRTVEAHWAWFSLDGFCLQSEQFAKRIKGPSERKTFEGSKSSLPGGRLGHRDRATSNCHCHLSRYIFPQPACCQSCESQFRVCIIFDTLFLSISECIVICHFSLNPWPLRRPHAPQSPQWLHACRAGAPSRPRRTAQIVMQWGWVLLTKLPPSKLRPQGQISDRQMAVFCGQICSIVQCQGWATTFLGHFKPRKLVTANAQVFSGRCAGANPDGLAHFWLWRGDVLFALGKYPNEGLARLLFLRHSDQRI